MSAVETLAGGCLCGDVRYEIRGAPKFVAQCFCRDCQKATGTGHTTIIGVAADDFTVRGSPAIFTSLGDTGGRVNRHFCGRCGSRLFTSEGSHSVGHGGPVAGAVRGDAAGPAALKTRARRSTRPRPVVNNC